MLDTHTLLWWFTDDPGLSDAARALILEKDNEVFVSAASAWEIATAHRLGRLRGIPEIIPRFADLLSADGFSHLPVNHLHALTAGGYELAHRDPFDRMLAAQSQIEFLPLITRDAAFKLFSIKTIW